MLKLARPLLLRNAIDAIDWQSNMVAAAQERDLPSAMRHLRSTTRKKERSMWGTDSSSDRSEGYFRPFSGFVGGGRGVLVLFYKELAARRMAAVALAMRLYEIDHGRRPERLVELVPQYLPAVPADPFVAGGKRAISYLPGAKRPRLYCIGTDGEDDGGKYSDKPDEYVDREKYDLLLFLNGGRPGQRPTKETPAGRPK